MGTGEPFSRIRRVFRLRNLERDLEDELAFHFEHTVEELIRAGHSRPQAEEEALRRFGDELSWRRELVRIDRRMNALRRRAEHLARLREDVRYAFRRMRRSPGLTAAVVLTFALGIGANATMFGIIDRVLLQPPAHVAEPSVVKRLLVNRVSPFTGAPQTSPALTHAMYQDFRRAESFSAVAAFADRTLTVERGEDAEQLEGVLATGEYFSLLGARPALGRFFGPAEDQLGAPGVAVVSYAYWQREYGGEATVLGETIDFGYGPYTIIGVAPGGFTGVNLEPVEDRKSVV